MDLHKAKTGKNRFEKYFKSKGDTAKSFRNSQDNRSSGYSRDYISSSSKNERQESSTVLCDDCGIECKVPFVPKTDKPVYCSDCFRQNQSRHSDTIRSSRDYSNSRSSRDYSNSRSSRDYSNSRSSRNDEMKYSGKSREGSTIAICDDCGIKFNLPFLPKDDRPVYCNECFRHTKSQYQENEFDSFDYRNKASRTDKKYEEKRKGSRSKEKLSKKQESFFSGGSEKFYDTLREKLFETLGGKVCSSCGFRDERALGFRQINDNESFDNIKRGGFASSWGKYISDPELAREELKVLCLNCNETSRPYSPSKKKTENVKKKRKRFPR